MRRLAVMVATVFGVGYLPGLPATWASFVTALVLFPLRASLTPPVLALALLTLTPVAILVSGEAEKSLGHDARPIVIDEVAGMLVGALGLRHLAGTGAMAEFVLLFGFFRVFDIAKPWPVRQIQALPGGFGVVVDDLLAGVYTAAALWVVSGFLTRP